MNRLPLFALLAFLIPASCGQPDVTITYHQTGACNGGQGQSGDPSTTYNAGPNQAYVLFGIESVNNATQADFNFDPTRLFVNTTAKDSVDPSLMIYQWILGSFASVAGGYPAGGTITYAVSGQNALVVQTTNANGSVEANKTPYLLNYAPASGDPGILLVKSDASQTSWPDTEDCGTISLH